MTTYSEAVCHAGQLKNRVVLYSAMSGHIKRSDMDHTVLPANNTMSAFPS